MRHLEWFHDHVRVESMAFEGALTPHEGLLRLDDSAPGNGLTLRTSAIEKYRVR